MRRLLLGVVTAAVAISGSARADVFVPDDPPPRDADCMTLAGDLAVASRGDDTVELSAAGGPWRRLAGLEPCPRLEVAADGTAAIVSDTKVVVRPPGGGFGAPVPIGRARATDVAVAPGGWVALARDVDDATTTTVLAPDGTRRSATVTRRIAEGPRIGVDAGGTATAAWTTFDSRNLRYVLHVSGGAPRTFRAGPDDLDAERGEAPFALAVSPAGRTIVAWADGRGVRASVDGGAPERLSTEVGAGSPAVAVADDGSAVVAYAGMRERVLVASRGAGGAWTLPRLLRGPPAPGDTVGGLAQNYLETLIAGGRDGVRAAVAWRAPDIVGDRAFAASGRPGGEWTPAAPLSAVTRDAFSPELLVAPDGTLRAAWSELRPRVGGDLFRAARLSPTPSPDTTPPAIDTRLPARTKLTRNGRVSFRIPVTCSEACDARVRVISRQGHESVVDVRELPAGRTTTFRLGPEEGFANELLQSRRNRRPRLEVLVTDRAGNVGRRSRTVVVPVRRRGILGLRVSLDHDFGMSSRAGNRAVARLVNRLITRLARNEITSYDQLHGAYLRSLERVSHRHDEVLRSAVIDKLLRALRKPLARFGYDAGALNSP